jgi:hypothetical protein
MMPAVLEGHVDSDELGIARGEAREPLLDHRPPFRLHLEM